MIFKIKYLSENFGQEEQNIGTFVYDKEPL